MSKPAKLSDNMRRVLANLLCGVPASNHCVGRSEFGGMTKTLRGLRERNLIDASCELTDEGRRVASETILKG